MGARWRDRPRGNGQLRPAERNCALKQVILIGVCVRNGVKGRGQICLGLLDCVFKRVAQLRLVLSPSDLIIRSLRAIIRRFIVVVSVDGDFSVRIRSDLSNSLTKRRYALEYMACAVCSHCRSGCSRSDCLP